MAVDLLMTCDLLLLMSYSLAGALLHEVLGIALFVLLIAHHVLSFGYLKALLKGRRSPDKIAKLAVDALLLLALLAQLLSAVQLSQHVFAVLGVRPYASIGRTVHLLGAYWGLAFMGVHLGFHLDQMLVKPMREKNKRRLIIAALAVLFCAGLAAAIRAGIFKYMLLLQRFVFFDTRGGLWLFLLEYLLILAMFAAAGFAIMTACKQLKSKK